MKKETALRLIEARIEGSSLVDLADEIGIPAADLAAFRLGVALGSMHMLRLEDWCAAQLPASHERRASSLRPVSVRAGAISGRSRHRGVVSTDDEEWGFVRGETGVAPIPTGMRTFASASRPPARSTAPRRVGAPAQPRRPASVGRGSAPSTGSSGARRRSGCAAIRAYAVRRADETSVRRLAAEIGPPIQPSALHVFLQGAEPYSRNGAALRAWYERVRGADAAAGELAEEEADAAWRKVPRGALVEFYAEEIGRTSLRGVARETGSCPSAVRNFINRGPDGYSSYRLVRKLAEYYLARNGTLTGDPPVSVGDEGARPGRL
jgi:hypothetical protein